MRASHFMWAALTIAVGVALFLLKYKVQDLEHQLVRKQAQILRDRGEIRVLEAEWTYLNDPEHLQHLSEKYLGFRTASPQNVAKLSDLPFRNGAATPVDSSTSETPSHPQVHTELRSTTSPGPTAATERPSFLSVSFARLQRLLLPTAAGATTLRDER